MGHIHGTVNGKKCKVMKMAKESLEILIIFLRNMWKVVRCIVHKGQH